MFNKSLFRFPSEKEPTSSVVLMEKLTEAELAMAKLQTELSVVNTTVRVSVIGLGSLRLAEAIKRLGVQRRVTKLWKSAAEEKPERLGFVERREKDSEYKVSTVDPGMAMEQAVNSAKLESALVQAISAGNREDVTTGLPENLFL